ncbi:DUF1648 domain-containing protein [Enorma phocaeensis]|uniref:DUF1648 domain-containing protein n=1 Tax=Enorma phocaeensis TaxID=1871019 RepID=A0A921IUP3_9ACTN|nr:DUF1648 domain-containing protein [Enorma phocaeensis]HJG36307.1 DUF1648 domain-containing protein [Enorma phocaeensis]
MKSVKSHIVASAVLCALTLVVTLAARGALPEQVPMQWGLTGEASSFWPRDAVVFGVPAACIAISLLASVRLAGRGEGRVAMYYIAPAVALVATAVIVFLGTR